MKDHVALEDLTSNTNFHYAARRSCWDDRFYFRTETTVKTAAVPLKLTPVAPDSYGTTETGGAYQTCLDGCGTIFRLTAAGAFSTIYSFCVKSECADGEMPVAAPMQATDRAFYGTAKP